MYKIILFDMDGTLVDTELAAAKTVESCFFEWGHKITEKDRHFVTGRTWASALSYLFGKYPPPISEDEAEARILEQYRAAIAKDLVEIPGARECVKDLAQEYTLALVSGSHRQEILQILDQLGIRDAFRVILGAEDYPRSKPAPDGYQKALELLGGDAATALVFEDSSAGVASGIAVGAKVCAVTCANHFGEDASSAHYFVKDLTGVNRVWVKALKAPANSG